MELALPRIVEHLNASLVLAYPTETVYGFGSGLTDDAAERVAQLKFAGPERRFIALVDGMEMAGMLGVVFEDDARALARRFWPGPLTLLVRNASGGKTGVRWTPHEGAARIIRAFGRPITSTSANRTGLPPATTAEEIVREWDREVRSGTLLVLDGGAPVSGVPSSIVDCTESPPRIVRSGAIDADVLRAVIPRIG
jgi:L-threonylcarbamoyladenylate synthase